MLKVCRTWTESMFFFFLKTTQRRRRIVCFIRSSGPVPPRFRRSSVQEKKKHKLRNSESGALWWRGSAITPWPPLVCFLPVQRGPEPQPEPELSCGWCLALPPPPPSLAVHCGPCWQAPCRDAACGALTGGAVHASCVVAWSLLSLQQRLCNKLKSIFLKGVSAVCFLVVFGFFCIKFNNKIISFFFFFCTNTVNVKYSSLKVRFNSSWWSGIISHHLFIFNALHVWSLKLHGWSCLLSIRWLPCGAPSGGHTSLHSDSILEKNDPKAKDSFSALFCQNMHFQKKIF